MSKYGYWVDLERVTLDENNVSTIQGMPLGEYEHPVHGTIKFTEERIQRFADNVNNKVRGTDLDIDYDHKAQTMEAAGWVQAAEATPNGLNLKVEWTKKAAEKIRNKEYRYFSPEFADEWQHPKSGMKFNDVLFGGALTNRPFLKDILPVNLSELFSDDQPSGGPMDGKELRKLLKLSEDATDDEVREKLGQVTQDPSKDPEPKDPEKKDPEPAPTPDPEPVPDDENKELSELLLKNPALKSFMDKVSAMEKKLDEQAKTIREQEIRSKLSELSDAQYALPPSVEDQLVAALSEDNVDLTKIFDAVSTLKKTGFVQLDEYGRQRTGGEKDQVDKFSEAVKGLMEKDSKLSYADAAEQVAMQDPVLYEAYRQGSYSFKEA